MGNQKMPELNFFKGLGIFVRENFLDREFCTDYLAEALSTDTREAQVRYSNGLLIADYERRKTKELRISKSKYLDIKEQILAIKPSLENYFNIQLQELTPIFFYNYQKGDFFEVHRDVEPTYPGPDLEKNRRISIIIFVNGMSQEARDKFYSGGELTFYGLIKQPGWEEYGFSLIPKPGLLIAFPSNLLHEVKPVTRGERYTIVSWFI